MTLCKIVMARLDRAIGTNKMASNDGPVEPDHDELQQACTSAHRRAGMIPVRVGLNRFAVVL